MLAILPIVQLFDQVFEFALNTFLHISAFSNLEGI